jgi:hypothetical protein
MFSYSTNSLHLLTHNTIKKSVIVLITLFLLQFFSFSMNISQIIYNRVNLLYFKFITIILVY